MASHWGNRTLRTQEEIDNYKEHECFRPWKVANWMDGKVKLEVVEHNKFFKDYDKLNKFWEEAYTRTIGFLLWVNIPEIPEDVLIDKFKHTIQYSDVNYEYYFEECLNNVKIDRTYHNGIILSWCESEHNPEWVCYQMSTDLYRMMLRLAEEYAPTLAKAEKKRR